MRSRLWWLVVLAGLPAAAFVFVPQRAQVKARTVPHAAGQALAKMAPDGTLLTLDAAGLHAHSVTAKALWRCAGRFEPLLEVTDDATLTVAEREGKRVLIAFDAAGAEAWTLAIDDAEQLVVPRPPADSEASDLGVANLLRSDTGLLRVIDLGTGRERGRRALGKLLSEPLIVEDSLFAVVDAPGGPRVAAADLVHTGEANDPVSGWQWPVPAGETVRELTWSAEASVLLVHGQQATYALE